LVGLAVNNIVVFGHTEFAGLEEILTPGVTAAFIVRFVPLSEPVVAGWLAVTLIL
jgi:hypothetical protein